uniref:Uncharacterized protein LOC111123845 isoform X1 n=1 Tax=Crassostrea virginica TaxID=6565 RepID=A0A8B8D378_CRAVI|nr:uncharacterized protein LOC111123845 isoform X1 [Crassostrea virginica]
MKHMPHLNGGYKQHGTPISDLSTNTNMERQENMLEDLRTVQRGFCFLKENLHREEQLAGYLYLVCGLQFTDDEKLAMCNGANPIKTRERLMHLMQKGNDSCREFLKGLQACHEVYAEFRQSLQHEVNADVLLTLESLAYYKDYLVEEIEPTILSDELLSHFALNLDEHHLIEQLNERGQKVEFLITKIKQNPEKLPVFCQALNRGHRKVLEECSRAPGAIPLPRDSESCIRINFRNLLKSFSCFKMKEALCKHLYQKGLVAQIPTYDKECRLIKAGMKLKKPGCDCFLEFIRWDNLAFLEKLISRFEERRKNGRTAVDFTIDRSVVESQKKFLLEELEARPISNVLLEENVFSIEDHDDVNNLNRRRDKTKTLYRKILEKSPEILDPFLFALNELKYSLILKKLKGCRGLGILSAEEHHSDPDDDEGDSFELKLVAGNQNVLTDIADSLASELEVILSIPVEDDVVDQAVDTINNDNNLKEEIVGTCGMAVIKAEKGSVVLRLVPLTDDACGKLLDEKGQNVAKMLTVLLQHSNLQKEIKGKIGVKILLSGKKTEGDPSKANSAEVKFTENLSLLEEELEPSLLVSNLQRKGVFTEDHNKMIMDGKSRKEKIRNLLKTLLKEKGEDAYETLISSLKELGKDNIIEKIKPPPNSHQEAEFVRKGLLHNFKDVIDEMESNIFEDTFQLCGLKTNSMEKIEGKSRKDRAFNFLMTVMLSDVYVLAFKKALIARDLEHLIEMQEIGQGIPMEESNKGQPSKDAKESDYKEGDLIFECQYEVVDLQGDENNMDIPLEESNTGQPSKDAKESDYKEGDIIYERECEVVDPKGDEKMEVDSSSDSEPMDVQFPSGPKRCPGSMSLHHR